MKESIKSKITNTLGTATGNSTDIFYALYCEYLKNSSDEESIWNVFRTIVEYSKNVGDDDAESDAFNKDEINKTKNRYWPLLKETIHALAIKNMPEEEFYKRLYKAIFESVIFPVDDFTYAVLLEMMVLGNNELPYFQLPEYIDIDEEEFQDLIKDIRPYLDRAINIMDRHLETKTNEIFQLYKNAEDLDDRKKIVYWAVLFHLVRKDQKSDLGSE